MDAGFSTVTALGLAGAGARWSSPALGGVDGRGATAGCSDAGLAADDGAPARAGAGAGLAAGTGFSGLVAAGAEFTAG